MTRRLSASRRERMRVVQESSMQDRCVHMNRTATQNSRGEDIVVWQDGATFDCGFEADTTVETDERGAQIQVFQGKLRLPLAAQSAITSDDKVRITHRYGDLLSAPLIYGVAGTPVPGPSALVLSLKEVTA